MINSDQTSNKSARPVKNFVARLDDRYKTDEMQDCEEFVNYLVLSCSILERLTSFSVDTTYQCRNCGTFSVITDNMNIRYENVLVEFAI